LRAWILRGSSRNLVAAFGAASVAQSKPIASPGAWFTSSVTIKACRGFVPRPRSYSPGLLGLRIDVFLREDLNGPGLTHPSDCLGPRLTCSDAATGKKEREKNSGKWSENVDWRYLVAKNANLECIHFQTSGLHIRECGTSKLRNLNIQNRAKKRKDRK
jgi:hypothetical protein